MAGRFPSALVAALCLGANLGAVPPQQAAKEHADKAAAYVQEGDLQRAEAELRIAVSLAPGDASYLTSLGGILGMQGNLQGANVYFERAVKANPADTVARRNLAANQWRLGQLKEAQANLERLLRAEPRDPGTLLLLGMVSENLHDYARAAKLLGSVPALVDERPESVAALASAYYHIAQRERAHELLARLLGRPAAPQGIFTAAGVAAQAEDYGIAGQLFESIRASYPDKARLEYNLALIQYRTDRVAESQTMLNELVSAGHATGEVYNLLGWCYQKQGNTAEAVRALENAIRVEPSKESNYLDLTTMLIRAKRLPAALKVASQTAEGFPASEPAFRMLGLVHLNTYQYTDAVRAYRRAVELDPSSIDAQTGLASAQWGAGMRADSAAGFEALIKQHPRKALLYETYGRLLLEDSTNEAAQARAVRLLKTTLELDDARAEAHYQLGNLALKNGKSEEAREHLERAARLEPRESKIQYALARLYRRMGHAGDAARAMRRYEELKAGEDRAHEQQPALGTQSQ